MSSLSRRSVLKTAALGSAAAIASPYVRGAYAAGSLTLGCWDHWVPGANAALDKLAKEWGDKNKVEVKIDYITSQGEKDKLTAAAEAQAGTGHDIMSHRDWNIRIHQDKLEPLDDLVNGLIGKYGPISPVAEYLAKIKGSWRGVPTTVGSQVKPCCSRIDLYKEHAGIDIPALFPADESKWDKAKVDGWNWDTYVTAAQKLFKAGFPVGLPMGQTSDAVDWVGGLFNSYGVVMVDAKDNIKINSDETRVAMEIARKIMEVSPPDVYAWDDAGNNRWLISGKGSNIMNPPSAWAVAKRDAPQIAEQCWTHGFPAGPKGRFAPFLPYFWSVWSFSKNKEAAKSLIVHLSKPASIEKMVVASGGYDLPAYEKLTTLKVWQEQGPPKGTLYHYPNPYNHQTLSIAASPAPPKIAQQIYAQATMTKMCLRYAQGEKMETTLAWAEGECEGFMRS